MRTLAQLIWFMRAVVTVEDAVRHFLNSPEVARAVQMLEDGFTQRQVGERLGVSRSVVARPWRRSQDAGDYVRRQNQGRRRSTTAREDRYLVNCALRKGFMTARQLQNDLQHGGGTRISNQTVRNRLREEHMRATRPVRGVVLSVRHRRARLDFAQEHQNWRIADWATVLFSNESRFTVSHNDGRMRVWRRQGERFAACNVVQVDAFGGGSIMVWAGICLGSRTDLHIFQQGGITLIRYRDEILEPVVRPFAGAVGDGFIFMQDNARPHTARVSMNFLQEEGIHVMDWPARSPDLNPIEHCWDMLGRRVRARNQLPRSVADLRTALLEEWVAIPQNDIDRLIRSMPNRCVECANARGGHTSY